MVKSESLKESINNDKFFAKIEGDNIDTFTKESVWRSLALGKKYYLYLTNKRTLMAFYVKKIIFKGCKVYNLIKRADNVEMLIEPKWMRIYDSIEKYNEYIKTNNDSCFSELNNISKYILMRLLSSNNINAERNFGLYYYVPIYGWHNERVEDRPLIISAIWYDEDKSLHCEYNLENGNYFSKEECVEANKPKIMEFDDNTEEEDIPQTFDVAITMKIEAKSKEDAELKIKNALDTITIE